MKDKNSMSAEERALAEMLEASAKQVEASRSFKNELEKKLMNTHKPKAGFGLFSVKKVASTISWTIGFAALTILFIWVIRAIAPQPPQPAAGTSCPVTKPNGSLPPGETVESQYYLGNGQLWTTLWPDGKVLMEANNQETDGSFSMKWGWVRAVTGPLTIEGHRLDAQAEPLRADIPNGYGDTGFQVSALIFPSTGCWEVTGHVGDASLTFVTEVIFGKPINVNATPVKEDVSGYDFRGGILTLAEPLPASPATANVYSLKEDQLATADDAIALAARFGIQGEVYKAVGRIPDTIEYAVSDGKQMITVRSNHYFFYTSDMVKNSRSFTGKPNEKAEGIIGDFLTGHGFDFKFSILPSDFFGGYIVRPLAPDGLPMEYELNSTPIMRVVLDENGAVFSLDASMVVFDQTPLGIYGIISAEEALQMVLNDVMPGGKIESMHSGSGTPPQQWYRQYADGEQVTIYGTITIAPALDPSRPALLVIDGTPLIGNTSGLEALNNYQYVKAAGKYISENGIRKFAIDSWDSKNATPGFFSGSLHLEGDQTLLTSDDGSGTEYALIDPPADIPLNTKTPESQLFIYGMLVDGKIDWTNIQYFADASQMGGGGGGGGLGFYKLNLSGTPAVFPTPTQILPLAVDPNALQYVVREGDTLNRIASTYGLTSEQLQQANGLKDENIAIGQSLIIPGTVAPPQLDGVRGMSTVTIIINEDGTTQRVEYNFTSSDPQYPYMLLEGDDLEALQAQQNKPIKVWGTADHLGEFGYPVVKVNKFEILYPDLQFQILKGSEKAIQLEDTDVILFTAEDGEQYVELAPNCTDSLQGSGDKADPGAAMMLEVLAVPDLKFGGYPTICTFSKGPASDSNGNPVEMTITADQPNTIPASSFGPFTAPNVTIDKVELIYNMSNPNFQVNDPNAGEKSPYIQPVWHFHGHYDSGDEVDIMIQALKREFLSPELETYIGPG